MLNPKLSFRQSSMYQQLLRLCEAAENARTEVRAINERIRRHIVRVAEHTAVAAAESRPQSRATWIRYARLSLTRLAGVLDVAASGKHLSDDTLATLLESIHQLDIEFDRAMEVAPPPRPPDAPADAVVEEAVPEAVNDPPSADVLSDLRQLAERDGSSVTRPQSKSTSVVPSD
jgi:hypothetical protein